MLGRFKSKPSDNYEDPQDVLNIKEAQENMGDFKLKTATNYKIPEHMRMNADKKMTQLAALEVAVSNVYVIDLDHVASLPPIKLQVMGRETPLQG